ncbi:MAG: translation initiation factor IF-2 associated domain-containing protein, partial [Parvibaculales bacterium]
MSDAETGDEGQKEDGGKSKTLSLKRTVESGQVRQSFSHGRSKSVLVEKRRKRILKLKRLNKKVSGYRRKAKEAGYARGATAVEASGLDAFMSCISNSDARRLMKYFPENIGNSS